VAATVKEAKLRVGSGATSSAMYLDLALSAGGGA
jgi:hypothetical protein